MLTYNSLLHSNPTDYPPSPERERHIRQESNVSINDPNIILSTTNPDICCDCDSYQVNNMACPCSARHAARMGRRATERILNRSPFFQSRDTKLLRMRTNSGLTSLDSMEPYDSGSEKAHVVSRTMCSYANSSFDEKAPSDVVELDPSEVEVIKLLGQGGFCEVHAARLVVAPDLPNISNAVATSTNATSDLITSSHNYQKHYDDITATSTSTVSQSNHSTSSSPKHEKLHPNQVDDALSSLGQSSHSQQHPVPHKLRQLQGRDYCIKFLKPSVLANRKKFARGTADLCIEAHFLSVLSHPHIVKLRGVTEGFKLFNSSSPNFLRNLTHYAGREGCCFVVLDRLKITLDEKIGGCWKHESDKLHGLMYKVGWKDMRGLRRRTLKLELLACAIQVAEALRYLHKHNIVYRDLKPDNIGFDADGIVKLFDFGLVKELKAHRCYTDGTYLLSANTGSRRYMAPEVAKKERYNLSADVYSFGILLWEICSLQKPFEGYSESEHTTYVVKQGKRPKVDGGAVKGWSTEVVGLMKECWDQDLHKRPRFDDIINELKASYKTCAKGSDYMSLEDQHSNSDERPPTNGNTYEIEACYNDIPDINSVYCGNPASTPDVQI